MFIYKHITTSIIIREDGNIEFLFRDIYGNIITKNSRGEIIKLNDKGITLFKYDNIEIVESPNELLEYILCLEDL